MKKIFILVVASLLFAEQPRPALVTLGIAKKQEINTMQTFSGTIFYEKSSSIASLGSGKAIEVMFENGEYVKKSQPLIKLDSRALRANIDSTKAKVAQLESELQKAQKDFVRYENLFKEASISKSEYENFLYNKKNLTYQLNSLKSDLKALQIALQDKTIKAPYDGQIVSKLKYLGEWIDVGDSVATIISNDTVKASFAIPYSIAKNLTPNQKVSVEVDGKNYDATLLSIIKSGNKQTRTFPIELSIKDGKNLFEGLDAKINLDTSSKKEVITVPRDSLINRFNQNVVFLNVNSVAQMIPVTVVGYEKDRVGISSPMIDDGASVIVKGNERVFPNQPIQEIK